MASRPRSTTNHIVYNIEYSLFSPGAAEILSSTPSPPPLPPPTCRCKSRAVTLIGKLGTTATIPSPPLHPLGTAAPHGGIFTLNPSPTRHRVTRRPLCTLP